MSFMKRPGGNGTALSSQRVKCLLVGRVSVPREALWVFNPTITALSRTNCRVETRPTVDYRLKAVPLPLEDWLLPCSMAVAWWNLMISDGEGSPLLIMMGEAG